MVQSETGLGMRRLVLAALLAALLGGVSAQAQISSGGKGGGFPGNPGQPLPDEELVYHVLDRLTYGHTQEDVAAIRQLGVDGWIQWQLEPQDIPESQTLLDALAALPAEYTPVGDPAWDWSSLYADYLLRARYAQRQLNEVMTEFWQNHFDTGLDIGNGGALGFYSSLAFASNGQPAIAEFDLAAYRPYYHQRSGNTWTLDPIDGRNTGFFLDQAIDPTSGEPSVSYYDLQNRRLKLSRRSGVTWTPEVVDQAANVGYWTSIAYTASGQPWISYYDVDNQDLKVATKTGGTWQTQAVDTSGNVGSYTSLALDAQGQPRVAYYDVTAQALKFAEWSQAQARWTIQVVDAGPGVGKYASLALQPGSEAPAIAYWDEQGTNLKYAIRPGGSWQVTVVDSAGEVGQYASLAFNASGNPSVAYREAAPEYELKLASWNGSSWSTQYVESPTNPNMTGEWSSLAFDPATGLPAVSFYNGSQFDLRFYAYNGATWSRSRVNGRGTTRYTYTVWEADETEGFRQNALGRFRDLLEVSATSPAMMLFLNNNENTAGAGNENYARELLELHTLSVDGGYTQTDVETVARAFTGWGIRLTSPACDLTLTGQLKHFCYNHRAHDGTDKTILGTLFPGDGAADPSNWMKQGHEILDYLARQPQTARFICRKLVQKFVADDPPARLWGECQDTFLHSDGDIKRVMETILYSPEFRDPATFGNKVRTAFEYTLAAARHLEATTDGITMWNEIAAQGMPLFRNDIPTGYSELGYDWVNSNSLLQRWQWADDITHLIGRGTQTDPYAMVRNTGLSTADGVVEYFLRLLVRGHVGALERGLLIDCLTNGDPANFDINDPQTPNRLRDTVAVILGFPEYQKQ